MRKASARRVTRLRAAGEFLRDALRGNAPVIVAFLLVPLVALSAVVIPAWAVQRMETPYDVDYVPAQVLPASVTVGGGGPAGGAASDGQTLAARNGSTGTGGRPRPGASKARAVAPAKGRSGGAPAGPGAGPGGSPGSPSPDGPAPPSGTSPASPSAPSAPHDPSPPPSSSPPPPAPPPAAPPPSPPPPPPAPPPASPPPPPPPPADDGHPGKRLGWEKKKNKH